jgi:hypothetical protein
MAQTIHFLKNKYSTVASCGYIRLHVSFRSPYLFCLLTVGVEVVYLSLDHTQIYATVGMTPLDEGSALAETFT